MVVEVCDELHREIRKLALLNDLWIYELTNAIIKEDLIDKKWSLVGLGVLIGLLGYYVIYTLNTMDFSQLQAYIDSLRMR